MGIQKMRLVCLSIFFSFISLNIGGGYTASIENSINKSAGNHTILEIKNLIKDAEEATWSTTSSESLEFGRQNALGGKVSRGYKKGGIQGSSLNKGSHLEIRPDVEAPTIAINFEPTFGRNESEVRGSFFVDFPEMKRIQLELMFDRFIDSNGAKSPAEFFVEVYEENFSKSGEWAKKQKFRIEETVLDRLINDKNIYEIDSEEFTTDSFDIVLSEWAGKSVRVDLVAHLPASSVTSQKGRWINAKIVGSTFDIQFDDEIVELNGNNISTKNFSPSAYFKPTFDNPETIPVNMLYAYPDNGINTVKIGSNWYAYIHATETAYDNEGTVLLQAPTGKSFYDMTAAEFYDCAYKVGGVVTPVLETDRDTYSWYGYSGITTSFGAYTPPAYFWKIHAFYHAEDYWLNSTTEHDSYIDVDGNKHWSHYNRIGYVLSYDNDPVNLVRTGTQNTYDVIQSFQPEQVELIGVQDPDNPDQPYDDTQRVKVGVGNPSIIKIGDYYYLFYTRWINSSLAGMLHYPTGDPYGTTIGNTVNAPPYALPLTDSICVARIHENELISDGYSSSLNAWKKFYDNAWDSPFNGYSKSVIDPGYGDWRAFGQVMYIQGIGQYAMICQGVGGTYLHVCTLDGSGAPTIWSSGIRLSAVDGLYPGIVGNTGYDELMPLSGMGGEGQLYYAVGIPGQHYLVRRRIHILAY